MPRHFDLPIPIKFERKKEEFTMSNEEIAKKIFEVVNAPDNVHKAENCMTRLRLGLNSLDDHMLEKLKKIEGVLGVNLTETELQVILGPGKVTSVTNEFKKLLAGAAANNSKPKIGDGAELRAQIKAKNATPFKLLLKKISSIFIPLIPGFIACGLITGILNIIIKIDPSMGSLPLIQMLGIMGNAIFWGMNLFVGVNAAKEFGGSPILGGVLAAIITHPALPSIVLYDAPLLPGRGGIIAVIMVAALGAWLEKRLHKVIPEMIDLFTTPLITIIIAGFAALFILQPIGGTISSVIGTAATTSIRDGGAIVGFVLGGTFLPMVMMGIHQALTPIHAELLSSFGVTILLPVLAMAGAGQVGASIAVYFKTKNKFLKKTVASALPVGIMGVGEPLIYGVTLPLGKPFICACIGGACGGAVQAAFMVGASAMGISGLPLAATTNNIPAYLAGLVTAYIGGFIATYFVGFADPPEEND